MYTQLFCVALELSLLPHAASCAEAEAFSQGKVREFLTDPNRKHAGFTDKISVDVAEAFQRAGRCRSPLYLSTLTSVELIGLRRRVCARSSEWGNWGFIPSRGPSLVLDGHLHLVWGSRVLERRWSPPSSVALAGVTECRNNGPDYVKVRYNPSRPL